MRQHVEKAHCRSALLLADDHALDVTPQGCTIAYAAPEVLRSLQQQCEGLQATNDTLNGPSADFWSAGVVLYELLTGELPFDTKGRVTSEMAPEHLHTHCKDDWEEYHSTLVLQQHWVGCLSCCLHKM